jgi:hypothetical protein
VNETTDAENVRGAVRAGALAAMPCGAAVGDIPSRPEMQRASNIIAAFLRAAHNAPSETREWTFMEWAKAIERDSAL